MITWEERARKELKDLGPTSTDIAGDKHKLCAQADSGSKRD